MQGTGRGKRRGLLCRESSPCTFHLHQNTMNSVVWYRHRQNQLIQLRYILLNHAKNTHSPMVDRVLLVCKTRKQ